MEIKDLLKSFIISKYLFTENEGGEIIGNRSFVFDFRSASMDGDFMDFFCEYFFYKLDYCNVNNLVIGGLEVGAVPFVSYLVAYAKSKSIKINAFIMRKDFKNRGFGKTLEGYFPNSKDNVILVDDTLATGGSFKYQVSFLEKKGIKVKYLFSIVQYLESSKYSDVFPDIETVSIFLLSDFKEKIDIAKETKRFTNIKNGLPVSVGTVFLANIGQRIKSNYKKNNIKLNGDNIITVDDFSNIIEYNLLSGRVSVLNKSFFNCKRNSVIHFEINGEIICVYEKSGKYYGINSGGEKKWENYFFGNINFHPVACGNVMYVSEFNWLLTRRSEFVAVDFKSGKKLISCSVSSDVTSCSLDKNEIFLVATDGYVYKRNRNTFANLSAFKFVFLEGEFAVKILSFNEKVVIITNKGRIVFFENSVQINILEINEVVGCEPLFYKERLYVFTYNGGIICISLDNCLIVFEEMIFGKIVHSGVVFDQYLHVSSLAGFVIVLDMITGEKIKNLVTGLYIGSNLIKYKNKIYFCTTGYDLFFLEI